jgi:hypothetical protein
MRLHAARVPDKPSSLRLSTLQHLTEICGRLSEERPAMAARLGRAYDLVVGGTVTPCPAVPGDVTIPASKGEPYRVGAGRCECADATFRNAVCKHRLARRLYWVAQAEEAKAQAEEIATATRAMTAEDYVRSGAQLAGVQRHEAEHHAKSTPRPSRAMARRCQEIQAEQTELRRAVLCGTADLDWSVEQGNPEERWQEWEEAVEDL